VPAPPRAAVLVHAGQAGRRLRPQAAGGPGRPVRRDQRGDAVHVPGLEHAHAREVPRPGLRHRLGGDRPRRDAGGDDRPAAREGADRHHLRRGAVRPDGGRGHRRHRRAARDRGRRRRAPRRQHGQPLAGELHHLQREPHGRLPRQRQRRDAGSGAGRPAVPHDRRLGGAGPAPLPHRPRHHAPEPVAGRDRGAGGGRRGAAAGAEQLPAVGGAQPGQLPVPELLGRPGGRAGALGERPVHRRQGRVHLPRRPDHHGPDARPDPPRQPAVRHHRAAERGGEGGRQGPGRAQAGV
ncbi:MAG: Manganese catalase, partial [uncultured Blastococcus sp.]